MPKRSWARPLGLAALFVVCLFAEGSASAWAANDAEAACRLRYLKEQDRYGNSGATPPLAVPSPMPMQPMPGGGFALGSPPAAKAYEKSARMAASPAPMLGVAPSAPAALPPADRERYPQTTPNKIEVSTDKQVSTFGADVDTTSYALTRRYILERRALPPSDAVRPEELINAFAYDYSAPASAEDGFKPSVALFPAPWNPNRHVLSLGIKAYVPPPDRRPALNLVFLLDISGSMMPIDRLPLAKTSLCMLLHQLDERDRIGIVVYASRPGIALESASAAERERILTVLDGLYAGGSTAGGEGLQEAYAMAERNRRDNMMSRIVLATDGDFNVGITDPRKLTDYVARKRDGGVTLTVLGFGMGNLHDQMMQALAQNGNGVAAYINDTAEARRILVDGAFAALVTVARDVKFQVEFNPARIAEHRLIGYETRALARTDFNNDRVDSGDVGAGHTVTAIYEVALTGHDGRAADDLRYGKPASVGGGRDGEFAFLRIRYKPGAAEASKLIERPITQADIVERVDAAPGDARFAVGVAWFTELLRQSPHVARGWSELDAYLRQLVDKEGVGQRRDFLDLVDTAAKIDARSGSNPSRLP